MKVYLATLLSLILVVKSSTPNIDPKLYDEAKNAIPVHSNIKLPKIEDIKRFAWYSAASVCNVTNLQNWDCASCKKVPSGTTKFLGLVESKIGGNRAYMAALDDTKEIIVVFRGGVNIQNAIEFISVVPVTFYPVIKNLDVLVQGGAKFAMESVIKEVGEKLGPLLKSGPYKGYKLVVIGHSLGGSVACLGLLQLQYDLKLKWDRLSLYTYGQFRTGNREFAKYFDDQKITVSRGVNYGDLVPQIFPIGLVNAQAHVQNEFWISDANATSYKFCDKRFMEDPSCSNSLPANKRSNDYHLKFFDTTWDEKFTC